MFGERDQRVVDCRQAGQAIFWPAARGRKLGVTIGSSIGTREASLLNDNPDPAFVQIPGLDHQDVALIPSILDAAGLECYAHEGVLHYPGKVFVRRSDLVAVKSLLADYRIAGPDSTGPLPIPWSDEGGSG